MNGRASEPRRVTITDVARHAGVALSTVSYVLSGKRVISATTRQRVLASVRALGYHPNAGARALASKRANVIALVLPLRSGMHVPVLMQFATAVVTSARRYDHDVLLMTADEGPAGLTRIAASALVDGLIAMDVEMRDSARTGAAGARPAQRADRLSGRRDRADLRRPRLPPGRRDLRRAPGPARPPRDRAARRAGRGVRAGHRLRPPHPGRLPGAGRAARRRPPSPSRARSTRSRSPRSCAALLAQYPGLTGLVVHNEAAVGHVLAALPQLGRSVPDDMSVVAICPDEVAERSSPPLSSVLVPADDVGREAVSLLMRKLDGESVPAATLLGPQLTVRRSTSTIATAASSVHN